MSNNTTIKEEYKSYTLGLALFDAVPVIVFLLSGIVIYTMFRSQVFLIGVLSAFAGGLSKVIWKLIIVTRKKDVTWLTKAFWILMSGGFGIMLLSVIIAAIADPAGGTLAGLWHGLTMHPAWIFFLTGFAGMCLMGYLGAHMDASARSNWIEEAVNTLAQTAVLIGVIIVYFGTYYHADAAAYSALKSTDAVQVTAGEQSEEVQTEEVQDEDFYFFDGEGTENILIFYPGAKVEAIAYAPLMKKLAESGTDCILCKMPLNFALAGKDMAADLRSKIESGSILPEGADTYQKWFLAGHSLGGVAASMLAEETEAEQSDSTGGLWNGIIFLASYPTGELSTPALSVYGDSDGVLNMEKYDEAGSEGRWPDDFTEIVLAGGNHAQFGSYGQQEGDGTAAISKEQQTEQTAAAIQTFVDEH